MRQDLTASQGCPTTHYIVPALLEFTILLPPENWDYRYVPLCPALFDDFQQIKTLGQTVQWFQKTAFTPKIFLGPTSTKSHSYFQPDTLNRLSDSIFSLFYKLRKQGMIQHVLVCILFPLLIVFILCSAKVLPPSVLHCFLMGCCTWYLHWSIETDVLISLK